MLRGHGQVDGVRLLKPDTVGLMTRNHLHAPIYPIEIDGHRSEGRGIWASALGVVVEPDRSAMAGSVGTYYWAGSWTTSFMVDPVQDPDQAST